MSEKIPARAIEGLDTSALADFDSTTPPTAGDTPIWDPDVGKYVPGAPTPPRFLVPLTTTVGGVPELVWDADDNLVMTEVPA